LASLSKDSARRRLRAHSVSALTRGRRIKLNSRVQLPTPVRALVCVHPDIAPVRKTPRRSWRANVLGASAPFL